MSSTIYTVEAFDFQITDAEIAEEFAREGHRVTAITGNSNE